MIVIFSPTERIWGGSQIYIEALCKFLIKSGATASIATSEPHTFTCPTVELKSVARRWDRLMQSITLIRLLHLAGAKVVVLNDLSALWLAPIFRLSGFKVISLLHLSAQKRDSLGFGHSTVELLLLRATSWFAHTVLSVNRENISAFRRDVQFVGNFVPQWFFYPRSTKRKEYDLGYVGRFAPQKNLLLFLVLVKELSEYSRKPLRAIMVGDGPSKQYLTEKIAEFSLGEQVTLVDWVGREELPGVYDQMKCFAITSHHEGFPTTLLESHSRGVPGIATVRAGYSSEFLTSKQPATGISFRAEVERDESFLASLLGLINDHESYFEACTKKARAHSEEKVLGAIASHVLQFAPVGS